MKVLSLTKKKRSNKSLYNKILGAVIIVAAAVYLIYQIYLIVIIYQIF